MSDFEKMLYDGILSGEFDKNSSFILDSSFPKINKKVEQLYEIFEKYSFHSLATAIFVINAWRKNRSAQENCLALNKTFILLEYDGDMEIRCFTDFMNFFYEVEPILQLSTLDDHVLNDFGEVKICFQTKFYSIITGTGHSGSVFAALNFLEEISKFAGKQKEALNILEFINTLLNSINDKGDSDPTYIGFEMPSEDFYNLTIKYLESKPLNKLSNAIIDVFSIETQAIEETHFCKKQENIFFLFNPSLLLDYQSHLLRNLTESMASKAVRNSLINKVASIYVSKNIIFKEFITDNFLICRNQNPIEYKYEGFVLKLQSRMLFFIESESVKNKKDFRNFIEITLQNNQLDIVNLSKEVTNRQFEGYHVTNEFPVEIVFYNNYIDISQTYATFGSSDDILVYTAVDLMFIILFASKVDEIIDFIKRKSLENTQLFSMGGIADYFIIWKLENGHISKGAIEYNSIYFEYESAASYIYEEYIKLQNYFPFETLKLPIGIPEEWNLAIDEHQTMHLTRKSVDPMGGSLFRFDNGLTIFLCYDFLRILKTESVEQSRIYNDFLRGLFERFLNEYRECISKIKSYKNQFIMLTFESFSYQLKGDKYSKIDFVEQNKGHLYLKCNVDTKKLMKGIMTCSDRSIENRFITEMFDFLLCNSYGAEIRNALKEASVLNKTVDASFYQADYYYNPDYNHIVISERDIILARKEIAIMAKSMDVEVGKYKKKDATKIVRSLQSTLIPYFENAISKFPLIDVHVVLLKGYSFELFLEDTNNKAYELSDKISQNDRERSQSILLKQSEDGKRIQLAYQYLIESNLFIKNNRGEQSFDTEDASKLLALSEWLVALQNNADICFSSPDEEIQLIVLDDYRVDIEQSENYMTKVSRNRKRLYDSKMSILKFDDNDRRYFSELATAFLEDTEVDFHVLEVVMRQLYEYNFSVDNVDVSEIASNVIRINKGDAYKDCINFVNEKIESDMVKKAYDFLAIKPNKLKILKEKQIPVLPIWEREKRDNRFTIKPLLDVGDSYLYSPITVKKVHSRWISGLQQFFPPYEIGLEKTMKILWDWKEFYEKSFANDIADIFKNEGFDYFKADVDIRKEDREGNHPLINELGDYDVIGLDTSKERIYLIECKVLQPIGSVYEHIQQQKRFFLEKKYDEKFQNRIDYFRGISKEFFMRKGFDVHKYAILSYMVVNKPFESYYKDVSFDIVTVDELKKLIDANYF